MLSVSKWVSHPSEDRTSSEYTTIVHGPEHTFCCFSLMRLQTVFCSTVAKISKSYDSMRIRIIPEATPQGDAERNTIHPSLCKWGTSCASVLNPW